ncbi:hypothetical protein [Pseudotenacibaculum haliotis]|uniref:Lipoprotein n=1 Tax=Pseudotenacibaculum haliotis TaxID=1862138 RepID=A0ABW5LTB5_9FLAO
MKYFVFFAFLALIVSCQKKETTQSTVVERSELSVTQKHEKINDLTPKSQKKIDDWLEYESLKNFLDRFNSISPNEALNNSKELNDLVKSLRDSVTPKFLESDAFKARVNLLLNESMRLYDMSSISSIKATEVNAQVEKLLLAFSSINSKINTVVKQADLDDEVNDPKFSTEFKRTDSIPNESEHPKVIKPQELKRKQKKLPQKNSLRRSNKNKKNESKKEN